MKRLAILMLLFSSFASAQTLETGSNSFTTNNAAFYPAAVITIPVGTTITVEAYINTITADGNGSWSFKLMRTFLRKPNGIIFTGVTTALSAREALGSLNTTAITINAGITTENGTIKIAFYGQQQVALNTKVTWIITRR